MQNKKQLNLLKTKQKEMTPEEFEESMNKQTDIQNKKPLVVSVKKPRNDYRYKSEDVII